MISALEPYPAYRDSGIDWLGQVPEGWGVRRLGSITTSVSRRGRPDLPLLSVLREKGVILRGEGDVNHNVIPEDLTNYKVVDPGDLVINKMKAWQGSLGVAARRGIVSPAYFVFRLHEIGCPYAHALLRSKPYVGAFAAVSRGIRVDQWDLSPVGMKAIPVLIPTSPEQAAIARFLAYLDCRIQRFIAAKDRLAELLNEEQQAISDRVLTRGLDADVPRKPSGVDFLGDVPEHWDVLDFGRMVDLLPGFAFPSAEFSEDGGGVRLLRGVNIAPGEVRWNETVHWPGRHSPEFEAYELKAGDLLLGLDRPIIAAGVRVAPVTTDDVPSLLHQRVVRLRTRPGLLSKYAEFLIRSELFRRYISPIFTGISVPHLSPDQVKDFRVPLPDAAEQERIVAFLSDETAASNAAIHAASKQTALLREYRTRLISDVVTGKLDVRPAAANLPDDPDVDDPALDERLEEVMAG